MRANKRRKGEMKSGYRSLLFWGALACLWAPLQTMAWGGDGHKTIGAIADQLIRGTPTEQNVKKLLRPGETLSSISVWADCAKGHRYCPRTPMTEEMKAFVEANKDHHQYHYTNVPIAEAGYTVGGVGTSSDDVVMITVQAIAGLKGNHDPAANPHAFTPRQSLLILAHMVGDLHQPLHVGAVYLTKEGVSKIPTPSELQAGEVLPTKGGNLLSVNGKTKVLHSYWDDNAVKWLMKRNAVATPEALAATLLESDIRPVVLKNPGLPDVIEWADGTLDEARAAFQGVGFSTYQTNLPSGSKEGWVVTLPALYPKLATDIAADQILLAGKRLAAILQATLK